MLTRHLTVAALMACLAACAIAPGNYLDTQRLKESQPAHPTEVYPVQLIDADVLMTQAKATVARRALPPSMFSDTAKYIYRIEPQDILGVTVWDHPELTTPSGGTFSGGGNTTQSLAGAVEQPYTSALPGESDPLGQTVAPDGAIFFPYVGRVPVAGKTVSEVRDELEAKLPPYIRNPQVDVRVLGYRSQKVQVTGDVKTPGPLAISDVPLTLVDAITRSGGTNSDADLQRVRLTRNRQLYVLDANALLDRGDTSQNVLLQSGDIIEVPDRSDSRVFVMGEVKLPSTVSMIRGKLTIADALTQAGGVLNTDANPRQIFIMRGERDNPGRPEIYRLDMTQADAMILSSQFQLQPLDVVYVSTATSATLNRIVQEFLPALQAAFYTWQLTK